MNDAQRALIGRLGADKSSPGGGTNPNRPEPGTVTAYTGWPACIASVLLDQPGSVPVDIPNATSVALAAGSRVLVLFYEPHGAVIIGARSSPLVGFKGTSSQTIPDAGGGPTLSTLTASYDPEGFLTGTGELTIPTGRDGTYTISVQAEADAATYTRLFTQFDLNGRNYRVRSADEFLEIGQTLDLVAGDVLTFATYQDSGAGRQVDTYVEVLLSSPKLAGVT